MFAAEKAYDQVFPFGTTSVVGLRVAKLAPSQYRPVTLSRMNTATLAIPRPLLSVAVPVMTPGQFWALYPGDKGEVMVEVGPVTSNVNALLGPGTSVLPEPSVARLVTV